MGLATPCPNIECCIIYLNVSKFTGTLPGLLDVKENNLHALVAANSVLHVQ